MVAEPFPNRRITRGPPQSGLRRFWAPSRAALPSLPAKAPPMKLELHVHVHHHDGHDAEREILAAIATLERKIMSTQAELASSLQSVTAKVDKIGGETRTLLQKIDDLTTAVQNAGNTTPEVDAALAALQAQVDVVDNLVPDAPAPEPAPAPSPEPPPAEQP